MKPYYQDKYVNLYNCDCLEGLKELPDDSVDLLATDPPYGIGFMGKDWDKALPDKEIWAECFRVLKAGAFAFVMSIPRADCLSRMIISLEDAGFWVNFTPIFWCFASGFPKAQNIGKAVDKRRGTHPDKSREFASYIKAKRLEIGIGLTKADEYVCGGTTNYSWFEGRPAGQRLPRLTEYERIRELLGLDNRFDEFIGEAEREVIGFGQYHNPNARQNWGDKDYKRNQILTASATPQAKALDGSYSGFSPKPAVEVIIVAMKPLSEKTFVDQALKNGKGISWLDDGRIPYESEGDIAGWNKQSYTGQGSTEFLDKFNNQSSPKSTTGRFPANLLVSDDVLNDGRITKGQTAKHKSHYEANQSVNIGGGEINTNYPDSGSFSRYFDLDKWWEGRIKKLPASVQKTFPFLIISKASKSEKNRGLDNNITVKYNVSNGGSLCRDEIMVAVQLLQRVISGLTARWSKGESGESIMVQFHRDTSSTILTETNKIIELKILPSLMHLLTSEYIQVADGLMASGGNPAESVENLREYLLTITNGNQELALGASRVVLETLLTISVRENWHENYNIHSTVKPLKLMSYLIILGSREGDVVLDPFLGSGTTALACKMLNRKCMGFEIEEAYAEISAKRCSQGVMELML